MLWVASAVCVHFGKLDSNHQPEGRATSAAVVVEPSRVRATLKTAYQASVGGEVGRQALAEVGAVEEVQHRASAEVEVVEEARPCLLASAEVGVVGEALACLLASAEEVAAEAVGRNLTLEVVGEEEVEVPALAWVSRPLSPAQLEELEAKLASDRMKEVAKVLRRPQQFASSYQ